MRKSLTRKPVGSVHQLKDRIDEYKRVEEDQQQGKGKAKVIPQEQKEFRSDRYNSSRPRRDFAGHPGSAAAQMEQRHTTEDCKTLWSHLEQLVKAGKLKQFLYQPNGQGGQVGLGAQRDAFARSPLGTISVILAAPGRTGSQPSKVMSLVRPSTEGSSPDPKRIRMEPHDDALVVTLGIGGYDVKRVLVNQGTRAEIMYPNLFKGLKLRSKDLTCYNSPLIRFDRKNVFSKGQIRLPIQTRTEVVEVNFIVADAYSPYTAI
ncbi:uncharacterized protein LOC142607569 [Castanea sativa]|uniref:uncharacterized protein LOC142607569 n=1 Tax=Castanea sativa TaxID=21020 RepID=UPI003F64AFEF